MLGGALIVCFVASAAVFALFVAARALVAAAARVPERLPPFGEAPLPRLARRSIALRLGLTLAGPAAVYLMVVLLWTIGVHGTGASSETSLRVDVDPSGPAWQAGVRDGDRIAMVAGERIARFAEIRPVLAKQVGRSVDLVVERDGRELHLVAPPAPAGSEWAGRLGVQKRPEQLTWGAAFARARWRPFESIAVRVEAAWQTTRALSGPIAITSESRGVSKATTTALYANMGAVVGATAFEAIILVGLFLFPFRPRRATFASDEAPAPSSAALSAPRPWTRFGARLVDQALTLLVLGAILVAIDPHLVDASAALVLPLGIPIEAALLASWGYTPGKWLMRVTVRDALGRKLRFGQALRRGAAVWTFGLAFNQSISWVTGLMSFRRLRRRGSTYWDEIDGSRVDHADVGGGRGAVAILVIAAFVVFQIAVAVRSSMLDIYR